MMTYERKVRLELAAWKYKMMKDSTVVGKLSKRVQTKVQELIPEKVHEVLTDTIKVMVQTILAGSDLITKSQDVSGLTLQEKDRDLQKKINDYKKIAAAEGAGTGAGGFLLGLADFPLLLGIKIKFLFDAATIYGFDTTKREERVFLLYLFQLAFSSDAHRKKVFSIIENWEEKKEKVQELDWRVFQQEYRDYIDLAKMLQLVPVIGAAVGAYANYQLLDRLGEVVMNSYRLRIIKEKEGS
ncbi:EcsC family protein [Bacillus sp. 165]|uniref:EcsC family protein n=1 Tax=Bacillus sp. 165 TaxID=1529117 RepID=UPI001ADA69E5|nr:EcsC family protein [Bacillus sp. 165]MBO9128724.1 EcsC family protein [Bacillus sp. 165]